MTVLGAGMLIVAMAGCVAPRSEVFSRVQRRRAEAFQRWRTGGAEDEALPQLSGGLSKADAVKLALVYSPAIKHVLEEQERAKGQLWQAYGEALPSVELSAGYTRLDEIMTVDLGVESFQVGSKDNWSTKVEVTQPLFKGGSVPLAIKGAKIFRYWNDEVVRQAVQDVVLAVGKAYDDVRLASRLYDVQVKSLEFAERNLWDVTARKQAGMAIRYDVLRAQVEVSNARADMIQQRNRRSRALAALFRAVGVSQKSDVELTDELTYVPMAPSYEDAVETAFRNRPELYQNEFDIQLQEAALGILRSRYWPTLEAWGWFMWAKPDPHESTNIAWGRQWQAGLRLKWQIFDGLRREGKIIQQRATLNQSIITLSDTEQQVLEEVRNAVLSLADAQELVESQQLNLQQANEALRLVEIGFKEGVNTTLEVLDARTALTRTQGLYYQALHAHSVARLSYRRALGLLGPRPGVAGVPSEAPLVDVIASPHDGETAPQAPSEPE